MPLIDELMANAWRPEFVETNGGWRYRWADGVTRRANSVLAVGAGADTGALVDLAETFYRERGAPALIQVTTASAPPDLGTILQERGYQPSARTLVEVAKTSEVVERTEAMHQIEITAAPTEEWFDAYWSIESARGRRSTDSDVFRDFLLAPDLPAAFAAVRCGSNVAGVGQIVIEHGWAGVQCMATRPSHRRRGIAATVLHALANEALNREVESMYLAVLAGNEATRSLYLRAGFSVVHEYCYFEKASPAVRD